MKASPRVCAYIESPWIKDGCKHQEKPQKNVPGCDWDWEEAHIHFLFGNRHQPLGTIFSPFKLIYASNHRKKPAEVSKMVKRSEESRDYETMAPSYMRAKKDRLSGSRTLLTPGNVDERVAPLKSRWSISSSLCISVEEDCQVAGAEVPVLCLCNVVRTKHSR